jgi:hypothetical protein
MQDGNPDFKRDLSTDEIKSVVKALTGYTVEVLWENPMTYAYVSLAEFGLAGGLLIIGEATIDAKKYVVPVPSGLDYLVKSREWYNHAIGPDAVG